MAIRGAKNVGSGSPTAELPRPTIYHLLPRTTIRHNAPPFTTMHHVLLSTTMHHHLPPFAYTYFHTLRLLLYRLPPPPTTYDYDCRSPPFLFSLLLFFSFSGFPLQEPCVFKTNARSQGRLFSSGLRKKEKHMKHNNS